jgi:eukaryotic-like serine/threonine-protein kinase
VKDAALKPHAALGRYEILAEVAQGAMGVVYKARDPLIDRVVAIKTVGLGLSNAETEAYERRFFREAKSAGRLNHPNVVTIHDVGKSGDTAYIAMEFLDGRSLREILDSGVVLPPERIADIVAQVAEGLAYAHRHQVVHRDVKPANIMVLENGVVKITDFGIALLPTGTRTLAGNVFGSPRYTSPEQVMGRTVDGRSDIFSLGAVLYELLTGLPPFSGADLNSILTQVLHEPTPAPSSHNRALPRAFDHIVAKALAKDPGDRYQDAQEMATDLRNFSGVELTSSAPGPLPPLEHPTIESPAPSLAEYVPAAEASPLGAIAAPVAVVPQSSGLSRSSWLLVGAAAVVLAVAAWWGLSPQQRSRTPGPPASAPASASESARSASAAIQAAPADPAAPAPTPARDAPADVASAQSATAAVAPTSEPARTAPEAPVRTVAPAVPPSIPASPAVPAAAADAKPPAPVARPTGRMAFAVTPWGEVHVDGRMRGVSPPLQELRLAPGKHVVEIRNSTFPPFRETVDVPADGAVRIKHKFQ